MLPVERGAGLRRVDCRPWNPFPRPPQWRVLPGLAGPAVGGNNDDGLYHFDGRGWTRFAERRNSSAQCDRKRRGGRGGKHLVASFPIFTKGKDTSIQPPPLEVGTWKHWSPDDAWATGQANASCPCAAALAVGPTGASPSWTRGAEDLQGGGNGRLHFIYSSAKTPRGACGSPIIIGATASPSSTAFNSTRWIRGRPLRRPLEGLRPRRRGAGVAGG